MKLVFVARERKDRKNINEVYTKLYSKQCRLRRISELRRGFESRREVILNDTLVQQLDAREKEEIQTETQFDAHYPVINLNKNKKVRRVRNFVSQKKT